MIRGGWWRGWGLVLGLQAWACAAEVPGWNLVWSDEFERPGRPDSAKWGYEKGLVRNREKQYYTVDRRENARVEGGHLVLEARHEEMDGGEYTSASLTTRGKADWMHGKVEVRAKLPAARGTWPAIWMMPSERGLRWPLGGEIDIMEHVGHLPGRIHGTLHTEAFHAKTGGSRGGHVMVADWDRAFHVYGMEWSEGRIEMFVDGKPYVAFERKPGDGQPEWPFDRRFYLILNLAVGGGWGGVKGIDAAAFPQRFEIDWVRVYQRQP